MMQQICICDEVAVRFLVKVAEKLAEGWRVIPGTVASGVACVAFLERLVIQKE